MGVNTAPPAAAACGRQCDGVMGRPAARSAQTPSEHGVCKGPDLVEDLSDEQLEELLLHPALQGGAHRTPQGLMTSRQPTPCEQHAVMTLQKTCSSRDTALALCEWGSTRSRGKCRRCVRHRLMGGAKGAVTL